LQGDHGETDFACLLDKSHQGLDLRGSLRFVSSSSCFLASGPLYDAKSCHFRSSLRFSHPHLKWAVAILHAFEELYYLFVYYPDNLAPPHFLSLPAGMKFYSILELSLYSYMQEA